MHMNSSLIKLCGVWERTSKNGNQYFAGKLSPICKIVILENNKRQAENEPTHFVYLSNAESNSQGSQQKQSFKSAPAAPPPAYPHQGSQSYNDDVPF